MPEDETTPPDMGTVAQYYLDRLQSHGATTASLRWSKSGQRVRFEVVTQYLPPSTTSLLDIGCGLGDYSAFLDSEGFTLAYEGWDLLEPLIEHCKSRRLPRSSFRVVDITRVGRQPKPFDALVAIGTFNVGIGDNYALLEQSLTQMIPLARRRIIVSLTSQAAAASIRSSNPKTFFYSSRQVKRIAQGLAAEVRIVDGYLPHDFLLLVDKPWRSQSP